MAGNAQLAKSGNREVKVTDVWFMQFSSYIGLQVSKTFQGFRLFESNFSAICQMRVTSFRVRDISNHVVVNS